ncbi:TetR/AcrR family transcriptional regulator [Candidatus Soleaferrea massiliensis]|uniref:TetR/AcrR family transcriptional regulator n=1 Tax=Candidatus Soleaferrea massiliensis TaxID=1470354 RepID=UPI00058C906C|nr:TetR/AcrR family transcriptional regulator [Candidatus Soleaferrea massiliensis]
MLMGKVDAKKREKKNKLETAAYELFTSNGFNETSIDQIAKKADVAKGTFYLYFKDKSDLINHVIFKRSVTLIRESLQRAKAQQVDDHIDRVIFLVSDIIEHLRENRMLLKVISKNLSWSLLGHALKEDEDPEITALMNEYVAELTRHGFAEQEARQLIFIVIELVSTVCYSSIIMNEPDDIDTLKPMLFSTIRRMLTK